MSLGALAYHIRTTLRDQTEPEAIETLLKWRIKTAKRLCFFFKPNGGAWNVFTNWRDMKLMEIDFSVALPDGEEGKQVKCLHIFSNLFKPFSMRQLMVLLADDPKGGIWMGGFFSDKKVWEREDGFKGFISADH